MLTGVNASSTNQLHIYCLGCQTKVAADRNVMKFHTGFYQSEVPLGACQSCLHKHRSIHVLWSSMHAGAPCSYAIS